MKIMYMGTPDISATVLKKLYDDGQDIVCVVTGEDKPRRRGGAVLPTPTKAMAQSLGIDVLTPATLSDESFLSALDALAPELIVVVAFGKILKPRVLNAPKYGCINLHVSLLPKYRGAAPMQRAIIDGESETGVCIMYMDEGLDTGDIIAQEKFPISDTDDFETVHDRSADIGGALLSRVIRDIEAGTATRTPQNGELATYAKKIEKEDCKIDFTYGAKTVSAKIRGVTPIPGAFCFHRDKMLKLFGVCATVGKGAPGEVISLDGKGEGSITVACSEGAIRVLGVSPEGRGRMSAGDFIRGRKIEAGDILK
ncbi:MAG: methionyl-tRNA formyltransferase [Clostridia bacterium]|nr:methionyl-tRNA formyltransferase [Clostridia bacterium]